MSLIKSQDGKKWINSFIVISSGILGYVFIRFLQQIKDWFDLSRDGGGRVGKNIWPPDNWKWSSGKPKR